MKFTARFLVIGAVLSLSELPGLRAADVTSWPMWRGPTGLGQDPGAQPPTEWSDTKNVKRKTKIPGLGYSTPIVWKDRIFLLTAIETNEDAPGTRPGTGAQPTPTKFYEFVVLA